MLPRDSRPYVPGQFAQSPRKGPVIPSLQTENSDPSSISSHEDFGRVAALRRLSSSGTSDADSDLSARVRKKAEPVKSACAQCQKRKTKCSGDRPTCRFCSERGLECSWDIGDGMTRTADLKQKLQDATGRGERLKRMLSDEAHRSAATRQKLETAQERQNDLSRLMEALRSSTDQVSTMLLARLRLGEPIEDLIGSIRSPSQAYDVEAVSPVTGQSTGPSGSESSTRARTSSNSPTASSAATASPSLVLGRTDSAQSTTSHNSDDPHYCSRMSTSTPALVDAQAWPSSNVVDTWITIDGLPHMVTSPTSRTSAPHPWTSSTTLPAPSPDSAPAVPRIPVTGHDR